MDNLDLLRLRMLEEEVKELYEVLALYANPANWHNQYDIPYNSPPGEGFNLIWNRQEHGWTEAARAIGGYFIV